ncbi:MAG: threonine--tRNA ligase [bacterium]|nr:threonine--tRNA ligase [bacterium]
MKIETIRHSLAHILATAVQELYPGTKFGIGPAIENGFYYDFEFKNPISNEDLPKIEKKMKEIIRQNIVFKKKIITKSEAKKIFKNQPYKLELLTELPQEAKVKKRTKFSSPSLAKQPIIVYESGKFIDLCLGPHLKSTKEINPDAFKLTKIAGAYWRGSEKNAMLTRIYGIAFQTKKELQGHLLKEVEAEKRDHRILGQKLDLFHIDETIGPGLILWHPKGALLKKIIMDYALDEYLKNGYQLVDTPHIAKLNLWKVSGHTDFYKDNMMPPIHMAEIGKEEKDDYQIKPMNCPFHIAIYKTKIRSYKNLPLRYTEMGTVYRYERSGTLHGLVRVRQITQDDAHIICTPEQLSNELFSALKLTYKILKTFGFKEFNVYLSTQPEKYVGTPKIWKKAENSLRYALEKLNLKYEVDRGGGAFYGPKIDIKIKDALEREWQCTTIQLDFNLPERFDMTYIDQKGKKQRPIMIHRALLGSLERFIGVLLEYYSGALPFWLSSEQIWIIPVSSKHEKYAREVLKKISEISGKFDQIRNVIKDENETVSRKIREGEIQKIPYLLVVGDKELKTESVRIRKRGEGDIGLMKLNKFLAKIK